MALDSEAPQGGVICLDLSREVGVAYGLLTDPAPCFDTWPLFLPKEKGLLWRVPHPDTEDDRFLRFDTTLGDWLDHLRPSALVIESTLGLLQMADQSNMRTINQQVGLRAIARCQGRRFQCAVSEVEIKDVREEILGIPRHTRRDPAKMAAKLWCRKRGLKVTDDNAAEAICIWYWQKKRLAGRSPALARPA